MRAFAKIVSICFGLCIAAPLSAHEITLDTAAASAVLEALGDPALSEERALEIAALPGNQALIRKVRDMQNSEDPDGDLFASELRAAAQGETASGTFFQFDSVMRAREEALATLDAIERDREGFLAWTRERITQFSPPGLEGEMQGYLIAGGGSTGFAFGGTDFYLNVAHFSNEPVMVRLIFAHEVYHGLQGAAAVASGNDAEQTRFDEDVLAAIQDGEDRNAYLVNTFLSNLLVEGAAMYVGDPALVTEDGRMSRFERERYTTQSRRMDRLAIQLDMSLISLTSNPGLSFDDAYALGFYGPDQPLYYLGYEMAKAIAEANGPARLGALITADGCEFTHTYLAIADRDEERPQLGPHTRRLVGDYCED